MKARPILFRLPAVWAIRDGCKTQTRRLVKRAHIITTDDRRGVTDAPCPYGAPKDWLWVRETWQIAHDSTVHTPKAVHLSTVEEGQHPPKWRSATHMPRWACQTVLEVVSVRVERVQEISELDAIEEGCPPLDPKRRHGANARLWFSEQWDILNGKGSWDDDPWVWVIQFKRL